MPVSDLSPLLKIGPGLGRFADRARLNNALHHGGLVPNDTHRDF